MTFLNLEAKLLSLKKTMAHVRKGAQEDFFSISGYPHLEVILSRWFGYFLESNNGHSMNELFAQALIHVLKNKGVQIDFDWLENKLHVSEEHYTEKGNIVDLVLYDEVNINGDFDNALVIEHKVGADLYNDFQDYYSSIRVNGVKLGVLLTAYTVVNTPKNFVNITYKEITAALESLRDSQLSNCSQKHLFYLEEFLNNLKRQDMTESDELFEFCFNNGALMEQVLSIKKDVDAQFNEVLRQALDDTSHYLLRRGVSKHSKHPIYIYFDLSNLYAHGNLAFSYWLDKELALKWAENDINPFDHGIECVTLLKRKLTQAHWLELAKGKLIISDHTSKGLIEQVHDFFVSSISRLDDLVITS